MSDRRTELETIITEKLGAFLEVGTALLEIRQDKLYQPEYKTFGAYIRGRWHFTRQRGYQFVAAAKFVQEMTTHVVESALPDSEFQMRKLQSALSGIPEDTAVRVVQIAANVAKELSPSGRIETPIIKALESTLEAITRSSAIDDTEGGQIALSEAFTAHLYDDMRERVERNKQHVRDALERKHGASVKFYEHTFEAHEMQALVGLLLPNGIGILSLMAKYRVVIYEDKTEKELT